MKEQEFLPHLNLIHKDVRCDIVHVQQGERKWERGLGERKKEKGTTTKIIFHTPPSPPSKYFK